MYRKRVKYALFFAFCIICYFVLLPVTLSVEGAQFFLMLILLPGLMFIGSAVWGNFYKFDIIPPLMAALLFVPPVYLFLNDSALFYALIYGLASLAGIGIGHVFNKYFNKA